MLNRTDVSALLVSDGQEASLESNGANQVNQTFDDLRPDNAIGEKIGNEYVRETEEAHLQNVRTSIQFFELNYRFNQARKVSYAVYQPYVLANLKSEYTNGRLSQRTYAAVAKHFAHLSEADLLSSLYKGSHCTDLVKAVKDGYNVSLTEGTAEDAANDIKAFYEAIRDKGSQALIILLSCTKNIRKLQNEYGTPLHFAVGMHTESIELVLNHVNIDAKRSLDGATALHLAVKNKNIEAVKQLLAAGARSDLLHNHNSPAIAYALTDLPLLKVMIERGIKVNAQYGRTGRTLLHFALWEGQKDFYDLDVIAYLLSIGADINQTEMAKSVPPLFLAAKYFPELIPIFMGYNPQRDHKDKDGFGAIEWAISGNQINVVEYLMAHDFHISPNIRRHAEDFLSRGHFNHMDRLNRLLAKFLPLQEKRELEAWKQTWRYKILMSPLTWVFLVAVVLAKIFRADRLFRFQPRRVETPVVQREPVKKIKKIEEKIKPVENYVASLQKEMASLENLKATLQEKIDAAITSGTIPSTSISDKGLNKLSDKITSLTGVLKQYLKELNAIDIRSLETKEMTVAKVNLAECAKYAKAVNDLSESFNSLRKNLDDACVQFEKRLAVIQSTVTTAKATETTATNAPSPAEVELPSEPIAEEAAPAAPPLLPPAPLRMKPSAPDMRRSGIMITAPAPALPTYTTQPLSFFHTATPSKTKAKEVKSLTVAVHAKAALQDAENLSTLYSDLMAHNLNDPDTQETYLRAMLYHLIRLMQSLWQICLHHSDTQAITRYTATLRHLLAHNATKQVGSQINLNHVVMACLPIRSIVLPMLRELNQQKAEEVIIEKVEDMLKTLELDKVDLFILAEEAKVYSPEECIQEINIAITKLKRVTDKFNSANELDKHIDKSAAAKLLIIQIGEYWNELAKNEFNFQQLKERGLPVSVDSLIECQKVRNLICHFSKENTDHSITDISAAKILWLVRLLNTITYNKEEVMAAFKEGKISSDEWTRLSEQESFFQSQQAKLIALYCERFKVTPGQSVPEFVMWLQQNNHPDEAKTIIQCRKNIFNCVVTQTQYATTIEAQMLYAEINQKHYPTLRR